MAARPASAIAGTSVTIGSAAIGTGGGGGGGAGRIRITADGTYAKGANVIEAGVLTTGMIETR